MESIVQEMKRMMVSPESFHIKRINKPMVDVFNAKLKIEDNLIDQIRASFD